MRIGLVIYGSPDIVAGGYLYDRMLVEHLRQLGDEVSIVSLPQGNYLRHISDNLSLSLLRRLERLPIDVLFQDELNHPSLVLLNRQLKRAGYSIVSVVHNLRSSEARPEWQNALYRWVERCYLSTVDAFIFNSQTTRRAVEGLAGSRPAIVAYPGGDHLQAHISESEIAERCRQSGSLRIIFLANVTRGKGLHLLIDAMEHLPPGQFELSVAGDLTRDRTYAWRIQQRVNKSPIARQIRFLGLLSHEELIPVLRESQMLVVPSFYEGFGIAYIEGMAFGLPAIACKCGATHEAISHGRDGFLVEQGDAKAIEECLSLLHRDRSLLRMMSVNARRRYLIHPTWKTSAERVRDFLRTMGS